MFTTYKKTTQPTDYYVTHNEEADNNSLITNLLFSFRMNHFS